MISILKLIVSIFDFFDILVCLLMLVLCRCLIDLVIVNLLLRWIG